MQPSFKFNHLRSSFPVVASRLWNTLPQNVTSDCRKWSKTHIFNCSLPKSPGLPVQWLCHLRHYNQSFYLLFTPLKHRLLLFWRIRLENTSANTLTSKKSRSCQAYLCHCSRICQHSDFGLRAAVKYRLLNHGRLGTQLCTDVRYWMVRRTPPRNHLDFLWNATCRRATIYGYQK